MPTCALGFDAGCIVGCRDGCEEGQLVGWPVGLVGWLLGCMVGCRDGCCVGWPVGIGTSNTTLTTLTWGRERPRGRGGSVCEGGRV